jgi:hypothetical protein
MKSSVCFAGYTYLFQPINLPQDACLMAIIIFSKLAPTVLYFQDCIHPVTINYIRKADALKTSKYLGIPLSYARGDKAPEDVFGTNLPRLRKLKASYDPKNIWSKGFVIKPDFNWANIGNRVVRWLLYIVEMR